MKTKTSPNLVKEAIEGLQCGLDADEVAQITGLPLHEVERLAGQVVPNPEALDPGRPGPGHPRRGGPVPMPLATMDAIVALKGTINPDTGALWTLAEVADRFQISKGYASKIWNGTARADSQGVTLPPEATWRLRMVDFLLSGKYNTDELAALCAVQRPLISKAIAWVRNHYKSLDIKSVTENGKWYFKVTLKLPLQQGGGEVPAPAKKEPAGKERPSNWLPKEKVVRILNAAGHMSMVEVAQKEDVDQSTVARIWDGSRHAKTSPTDPKAQKWLQGYRKQRQSLEAVGLDPNMAKDTPTPPRTPRTPRKASKPEVAPPPQPTAEEARAGLREALAEVGAATQDEPWIFSVNTTY